ncbi:MAG: nucleotidyltransferase domain-containing protein [Gemmatimonadaceae bacterium]
MAKMTLDTLVEQLRAAHGDALEAVVLYGSAARHQGLPTGTIDVLVIVRTLADSSLRAAGAATRAWMQAGHPAPLTLTSAEWRTSADVFAMEYADILSAHRVLHGTLHTDGLAVSRHDLRLQLEREVMGKLIQLRREMQARHGDGAAQRVLLEAAHGTVFAIFRAALRLTDGLAAPYLDSEQVARDVAAKAGFDATPFLSLLAHRRGTTKIADKDAAAVLRGCHDGLERLAAWLDGVTVDGGR